MFIFIRHVLPRFLPLYICPQQNKWSHYAYLAWRCSCWPLSMYLTAPRSCCPLPAYLTAPRSCCPLPAYLTAPRSARSPAPVIAWSRKLLSAAAVFDQVAACSWGGPRTWAGVGRTHWLSGPVWGTMTDLLAGVGHNDWLTGRCGAHWLTHWAGVWCTD